MKKLDRLDEPEPYDRPNQRSGGLILLIFFGLVLLIDVGVSTTLSRPGANPATDVVRLLVTVLLLRCVWTGMLWARIVLMLLLFLAGVFALLAGVVHGPLLLLAAIYLGTLIALFLPPVRAFLKDQHDTRATGI